MAAQSYRRARSVTEEHIDYEALMRHGHEFKARATRAVARWLLCERRRFGSTKPNGRSVIGTAEIISLSFIE
jgi:hypothetical protein